jgi:hypothetical protein
MQQGAAVAAVRDSVVRAAGAAAAAAYRFCASLDLGPFAQRRGGSFLSRLDVSTERLRRTLPSADRSWGAARSVIDRFMREALYNRYLCAHFRLERAETWLELPLDPIVARRLRSAFPEGGLPPWRDLRSLTPAVNSNYQGVAAEIAERKGIARVHLGTILLSPSLTRRTAVRPSARTAGADG